jgi:thiol:disulfide interchange protein DsbC
MTKRLVVSRCKMFLLAPLLLLLGLMLSAKADAQDTPDLEKAVKIGSGKTVVIEFTDPDCPFCHKAEVYFQGKPDVTRYIYFFPLKMHPDAKTKVQYILSAKDKSKAYQEVVADRYDSGKAASAITPEGIKLQKEHMDIAQDNKIDAVPIFLIGGRIIKGFDQNKLDSALR